MVRRITLVCVIASVFVALPAAGQPKPGVARIGILSMFPSANPGRFLVFKEKLRELGHEEGKTITFETRFGGEKYDQLPALAAELVKLKVDVIMVDGGTPPTMAAMGATRNIPIVFCCIADPVGQRLVRSLSKPGGNVTGVSVQQPEFASKSLDLFRQILPEAKRIGVLTNPRNASLPPVIEQMRSAAQALGLEMQVIHVGSASQFDQAFREAETMRLAGMIILRDAMFMTEARRLSILAATARIPTMGGDNSFPESGALSSYSPSTPDLLRSAAVLVDKVIKGANPSDLPVEQPSKFDFIVNRATARALGVTIPMQVLLRADRVID